MQVRPRAIARYRSPASGLRRAAKTDGTRAPAADVIFVV
jgi:hypothetical protein